MQEFIEPVTAIWPALIAAGASVFGASQSAKGLRRQNRQQIAEAQKSRDFQERMSSTAHQREVEDLRAAGLNPILSGLGGGGAATPSGAQANIVDTKTSAVSTAKELARTTAEIANLVKMGKNIDADTKKKGSEKTLTDTTNLGRQSELAEKRVSETIWDTLSQMFQTSSAGKPNLMDWFSEMIGNSARDISKYRFKSSDLNKGPNKIPQNKRARPNH